MGHSSRPSAAAGAVSRLEEAGGEGKRRSTRVLAALSLNETEREAETFGEQDTTSESKFTGL
jgi:hypothetical protein